MPRYLHGDVLNMLRSSEERELEGEDRVPCLEWVVFDMLVQWLQRET